MPKVLRAKTSLVVEFSWHAEGPAACSGADIEEFAKSLRRRQFTPRNDDRTNTRFWCEASPPDEILEVAELDPAFQSLLGFGARSAGAASNEEAVPWRAWWLRAERHVVDGLFAPSVSIGRDKKPKPLPARLVDVDVFLFPLQTGALVFHWEWDVAALPDLGRLAGHLAALRRIDRSSPIRMTGQPDALQSLLMPPALAAAFGEGAKPTTLAAIANWMLALPADDPTSPPDRVGSTRYGFPCTSVVLDERPDEAELQRRLFQLRRGADDTYVEPDAGSGPDATLQTRGNRRLVQSRDGFASLSWLLEGVNRDFEVSNWPSKFHGIYFLLTVATLSERATLAQLSAEAARLAAGLGSVEQLALERPRLLALAQKMARYTLSMVGDDPGGLADYAWFFREARATLGIPGQLEEARREIGEVFSLVETAYEEVRRRQAEEVVREQHRTQELQKRQAEEAEAAERRTEAWRAETERTIQTWGAATAVVLVPFNVAGAIAQVLSGLPSALWISVVSFLVSLAGMLTWLFRWRRRETWKKVEVTARLEALRAPALPEAKP
jgi:hypothetical protein